MLSEAEIKRRADIIHRRALLRANNLAGQAATEQEKESNFVAGIQSAYPAEGKETKPKVKVHLTGFR